MNRPMVQRLIWEHSSQLLISYRRGPLAHYGLSRPRPGDRVPDLACRDADGAPTRLHAEIGPGWAVVTVNPALRAACGEAAAEWLGAEAVAGLTPAAGTPRDAWLVRPDAHLAWRGTDPAGARRWLAAALHRESPARAAPAAAG
jgi:4,5-epoxidase